MTFKRIAKLSSVAILILLVVAALGPADWAPRSGLGWQIDHFVGYFVITCIFCVAWSRPFVVGGVLMAVASLLEALQALTPDRSANLVAACCSAGGALAAAISAKLFIRAR
jgi:VanZ family protein